MLKIFAFINFKNLQVFSKIKIHQSFGARAHLLFYKKLIAIFNFKNLAQIIAILFIAPFLLQVNAANVAVANPSFLPLSDLSDPLLSRAQVFEKVDLQQAPNVAQKLSSKSFLQDEVLIKWNSPQGLQIFERSKYKNDFFQLANFYQPQINPVYCAVASSVIVLNALQNGEIASQKELEILRPQSLGGGMIEFKSYSQLNFLNEQTDKIKNREIIQLKKPIEITNEKEIFDAGISLSDLKDILHKTYKIKVSKVYAKNNNDQSIAKFRADLKKYLADEKHFIIANFDGAVLKAKVHGHMSPLAAYDEEDDVVLVLDVALHKQNWYFVSVKNLYQAMNTKDQDQYRGYLIVSK